MSFELCRHEPGTVNRFCDRCDALVIAGTILPGVCGHERIFPPEFVYAPRSWCPGCEQFRDFGAVVAVVPARPPVVVGPSPFWSRPFDVRERRWFDSAEHVTVSLHDLGRVLNWPTPGDLARRTAVHRRQLYRWREYGLTVFAADTLAINACLHPLEVWGDAWEPAA